MDRFTGRQIVLFVIAFVIAGAIASMGTIYILRKVVIVGDPNDPLNRQGVCRLHAITLDSWSNI